MRKIRSGAAIDSLILTFVRVITAGISLVIYKLLAVNFSLNEYGLYSQAMLVSTTVTSITILGLTDAVNYFFNKDKGNENGKAYVQTIFALQFLIGIIGAILIFVLRYKIAEYFDNSKVSGLMIYVALLPLLNNLLNMLQVMFISYRKAKIIAIRNFLFSIVKVIVVVVASYILKSIHYVLVGSLVFDFITVGYMICYCNKNFFKLDIKKANFRLTKEIFIYSIPMAAYIVTNSLSRNMDKLIIGWYGDVSELALYTIASKELPFDMLTVSFITVLIPYITRYIAGKEYDKAVDTFSKYLQISYIITWIIAVGALISSKELLLILYDSKYIAALMIFCLYIIVDMLRFANTSIVFSAQGKIKELIIYSGLALLLNFILNIVFYNLFGITGPAVATVLISLLLSSIMLIRSSVLLKTNVLYLVNIKQMLMIIGECLVFGLIALVVKINFFMNISVLMSFSITYIIYGIPLLALNYKRIIKLLKSINNVKMGG